LPLSIATTPANIPDGALALTLLDTILPIAGKPGRPRFRPDCYLADRAYGWALNILATEARGVISLLARPQDKAHGSGLGKVRYPVERTHSWYNNKRRLRMCYEKSAWSFEGFHRMNSALICLNRALSRYPGRF
jgi:transposase